ncbi:SDR family NAD(P)-dependent oxidoreductase [Hymenobacter sp. BRD67]|uniref:SDR family NAD(P)-dependent oxidoreductase n=1 Tax=Hymenobacter sp. BRD67 TaxID=2675877 RepID=UPI0015630524|nr:SDR family oxidoreductase [Hymenobacter sp. BRD67]QKG52590.1 SDR family oxidoreductase [Hymenobacter sp. BRD67]
MNTSILSATSQPASAASPVPTTTPAPQPNVFSLAGRVALITGGGSGIGLEIARCMVQAGATVIITGRREAVLRESAAELGDKAKYIVNDICSLGSLDDLVAQVEAEYGPLNILVNNAGINMKKPALEVTDEEFNRIIQTNLNAVFSLTRAAARRMVARRSGTILMISSMAAYYGIDRVVAYAASKSAVEGMVKVLASEFSCHNVRVNAIAPGFIETEMSRAAMNSDPERRDRAMRRTPMGEFGRPADIGHAAVFLASEGARYITGVSLPVDGGNSIGF